MKIKRQGDILFVKVGSKRPGGGISLREAVGGQVILALGEKTGHNHTAEASGLVAYGPEELDKPVSWLEVALETTVEHQEHGPVVLEPGKWEVRAQQEYQERPRYAFD